VRGILFLLCVFVGFSVQAERLISAGVSLTEIIFALGAEEQLVGVDSSSQYPAAARALPDVGYYRALNVEGVLSVEPEKLLLLEGAGPEAVVNQLRSLGVGVNVINNPKSVEGLFTTIKQVATATERSENGKALVKNIQQQLLALDRLSSVKGKTAVFLMSAGERGLVAAGSNTTPQLIFDQLGLVNPFASLAGFKSVSAEILASSAPDIVLLASHTSRDTTEQQLCSEPQLSLWANVQGCNLFKVDSLMFLGLTPRLPKAIEHTHTLLVTHAN
jgi:iron complex transport system substrate-binding protein